MAHLVPNYEREVRIHDCITRRPPRYCFTLKIIRDHFPLLLMSDISPNYYKALLGPQNSDIQLSLVLQTLVKDAREKRGVWEGYYLITVISCEYMMIESNLDWSLQTAPH